MCSKGKGGPGNGGVGRNGETKRDGDSPLAGKPSVFTPSARGGDASGHDIIGIEHHATGRSRHQTDEQPALQPAEILARMRSYWDTLGRGRTIPMRSDIEPRKLRHTLDHAFILERLGPGSARFRLAGRHLIDLMGMEVRGMPLATVLHPSSRGQLADILETVFSTPQIAHFTLQDSAQRGKPALLAQMLLLPLRSDLGDVTRALGCLVAEGGIGVQPRRLNIISYQLSPAIAGQQVRRPAFEPSPAAAPPGFFEADTPWQPTPDMTSPAERRAGFRVITGDLDTPSRGSDPDNGNSSA